MALFLHYVTLFLVLAQITHSAPIREPKNHADHFSTYIVHADHLAKPPHFAAHEDWYTSLVATHSPRAAANSSGLILYTYDTVMHGFAVRLTDDEARRMSNAAGVTGVHEDRELRFLTTRSPGFLGLDPSFGAWKDTDFGDGVIIGFVDSGIWPENPSFNDSGLGPVRASWRGGCVDASMCNNKIVGAKAFGAKTHGSPRDKSGHGSHVASTAAGSEVRDIGFDMFARGTARGVAPKARIAMYTVSPVNPKMADVAMAIDAAVKDGVDIISVSIADDESHPFYNDTVSIATFGAARKGVFVVLAGGNEGPAASTLKNVAPWMTTVGAGTVDRLFPANLIIGDGTVFTGQSLYTMKTSGSSIVPLVSSSCSMDALIPDRIRGKIVFCTGGYMNQDSLMDLLIEIHAAGLVISTSSIWFADEIDAGSLTLTLPGLFLSYTAGEKLGAYMASEPYPTASFSFACETVIAENRAPIVAMTSSRGPNPIVPEILKPDIIAPGVNIFAAYAPILGGSSKRNYIINSGTSYACPHVAGVAALIKKKHPNWSPAMIRSAMMTTAASLDNTQRDILDNAVAADGSRSATAATPFATGAGHVRPQLAMEPGLVYDAGARDYVDFLCALNYTTEQLRLFAPDMATCTTTTLPGDLNYPSFVVVFHGRADVRTLKRTVTKVSEEAETYNVTVVVPRHVKVTVTPATLEFKQQYEKKTYSVEFRSDAGGGSGSEFGHIIWENAKHQVRSPVAIMWKN